MSFSNRPSVVPTLGTATTNSTASEDSHVISSDWGIPLETTSAMSTGLSINTSSAALAQAMEATSAMSAGLYTTKITAALSRTITFIDLDGNDTPEKFWQNIARPNLEEFRQNPTARTASNVATSLWSMTEWMWRKRHPTEDLQRYRAAQFGKCRSLEHVRDIAEAGKHCGLNRQDIKTARTNAARLEVTFSDGNVGSMSGLFEAVAAHWESELL